MSASKSLFIVPITTLSRKAFREMLSGDYRFLDPDFVLRNAVQLWVDYNLEPEGYWHSDVEEEVHREYGSEISRLAANAVYREGASRNKKAQLDSKYELRDELASKIARHISEVSTYLMSLTDEEKILDIVLDSEYEIIISEAWIAGRSVKFVLEEM